MKISRIREIINEEIALFFEAYETEKEKKLNIDKEKQELEKQKQDLEQDKLNFDKKQADVKDDREDREREEDDAEKEKDQKNGDEEKKEEPTISFNAQGEFYNHAYPNLKNLTLSNGDFLDSFEKHYVALAIEAAKGRFDKGFIKYLKNGYAGNVYGKDFNQQDIKKIVDYVKKYEIVR